MKILFICDEYPPGLVGGIGTITQTLARELVRQGHEVLVAGYYPIEYGAPDFELDHGVKVWRFRYPHTQTGQHLLRKIKKNLPGLIKNTSASYKTFNKFLLFVQSLIKNEQVDIVEMPDWNTYIYDLGIDQNFPPLDIPLIVKFHGSKSYFNAEMKKTLSKKWLAIDQHIINRADALVAPSSYTAAVNKTLFNIRQPIKILHNAIHISDYRPASEKHHKTVVFAGTLIEKKGVFSLLKAWNIIAHRDPEARLYLYGKGDSSLLKQILSEDISSTVSFESHCPRAELLNRFSSATLAIFPSYSETFGLVAIEAMSVGCPTIFTKRASGPEIIRDGETGFLIDPDNIEQIAEKTLLILQNKSLQKKLGEAGMHSVKQNFDIVDAARKHIDFYRATIENFIPSP